MSLKNYVNGKMTNHKKTPASDQLAGVFLMKQNEGKMKKVNRFLHNYHTKHLLKMIEKNF